MTMLVTDDAVIHRIGGAGVPNLRLSPPDIAATPPGVSVLIGGSPQEAAAAMRAGFPTSKKWIRRAGVVASASVAAIRAAGFDVIQAPTVLFGPRHHRIVYPDGVTGFTDENLARLSVVFTLTTGC